jgi:hypothetical protein
MEMKNFARELTIVVVASIILAISISYLKMNLFWNILLSIFVIISLNTLAKKFFAYNLETNTRTEFWSIYSFGFEKSKHFNKAVPMLWLPVLLSVITRGLFWWLPIISFDVSPRTERIARRHGLYRFTEVTEWHVALIAAFGIFVNIVAAIIAYFIGFEFFAKLSFYYAFWSIIPMSDLDGSKIFFGSRVLWFSCFVILLAMLVWGFAIVI